MATEITVDDIVDLRPRCYGCDSNNTRVIHPSAGFNETGKFLIQCGNCGRVRGVRDEHVREMLAQFEPQGADTVYQIEIHYKSEDFHGTVHSAYAFPIRSEAQAEADKLVRRYEHEFGWAAAHLIPLRLVREDSSE